MENGITNVNYKPQPYEAYENGVEPSVTLALGRGGALSDIADWLNLSGKTVRRVTDPETGQITQLEVCD